MRNLLIRLSPTILFIVLNMVVIAVISAAAMFITQDELGRHERVGIVFFWVLSIPVTAGISFFDTSIPRGLMRDILDLIGIKQ